MPLTRQHVPKVTDHHFESGLADQHIPCCYLKMVEAIPLELHTEVELNPALHTLNYILWVFLQTPQLVVNSQVAPCIHPKLQFRGDKNYLTTVPMLLAKPANKHLQELLEMDFNSVPLQDALTAMQALMLYLITFLFHADTKIQDSAVPHLAILERWVRELYLSAWEKMPQGLSHWQAWLLGESVRRTIIMSVLLPCAFSGWRHGRCRYTLCFEALPFDGRVGLWQAESPQAWISSANVKNGSEVGIELVSFHEFGCSRETLDYEEDVFLSMSLVTHNGKGSPCPITALWLQDQHVFTGQLIHPGEWDDENDNGDPRCIHFESEVIRTKCFP